VSEDVRIYYQDDDLLVVEKPENVVVHENRYHGRQDSCAGLLEAKIGGTLYPVHRLDAATGGVLLFARHANAARHLSLQFRTNSVEKRYLALVRGHTPDSGRIDEPVKPPGKLAPVPAVTEFTRLASSTLARPLGKYEQAWFSCLELHLVTGRTGQARRHLQHISHPILGDKRHGDRAYNEFVASRTGRKSLYLRAASLRVLHPAGHSYLCVETSLPDWWRYTLSLLALENVIPVLPQERVTFSTL